MADTFFGFNTSLSVSTEFVYYVDIIFILSYCSHFSLMTPKMKHVNENNGFCFFPHAVKNFHL